MEAEAAARWGDFESTYPTPAEDTPSKSPTSSPSNFTNPNQDNTSDVDPSIPPQSKSPASGSNESSTITGEPASTKQSGPGNKPSKSDLNEGAGGPQGPK
jgi:hypothetical protein